MKDLADAGRGWKSTAGESRRECSAIFKGHLSTKDNACKVILCVTFEWQWKMLKRWGLGLPQAQNGPKAYPRQAGRSRARS